MAEPYHRVRRRLLPRREATVHIEGVHDAVRIPKAPCQALQKILFHAAHFPLHHQHDHVFLTAGDDGHGKGLALRHMAAPAVNVLFLHVGQAQQHAVVAHGPDVGAGRLLEGPLHDMVRFHQLRRQQGKVVTRVAVGFPRVIQVTHM